ncbi:prepilin peptidase [Prochlorococcus marinus]|uniref:Type II secretory pathway, prepilin signal peptidase PulO-like peptidase n=1 Tax=Prochlorococcus marinus (strain MIT 9211) TaxID=93059 RepID=A9BA97_PROM4|nr:A24 family peptidase [Prochlorococcus marinus]ABX08759.1 Type II secretory pathway, prepilin signal peptidase PulO-like peptidase [Prochlorococcus marinus str. MIT 9211]
MDIPSYLCFVIGACFGSFISVVARRLPQNESPVFPRSYCPNCTVKIKWFDNIPILSWILLRGRCRNCSYKISLVYPFVEFFTGVLFVLCKYSHKINTININDVTYLLLGWCLVTVLFSLSLIDIYSLWLPESLLRLGGIFGIIHAFSYLYSYSNYYIVVDYLFASVMSYYFFEVIRLSARKILKKDALGDGDSKLIAMLGLWNGIIGSYFTIVLAFVSASIYAIVAISFKQLKLGQAYPLGPFIALSGLFVWIFGNDFLMVQLLKLS